MALTEFLILRKPCSGCLEERTALIQPIVNFSAASDREDMNIRGGRMQRRRSQKRSTQGRSSTSHAQAERG
jgi:hypothetical protein